MNQPDREFKQPVQASLITLAGGVILLGAGVCGIYLQGRFWASEVWMAMNGDEVALALGLPAGVTITGSFMISYIILASPLTATWNSAKRCVVFAMFAFGVIAACAVASWFAGRIAAQKLQTTELRLNQRSWASFAPLRWATIATGMPAS